MKVIFDTDPGIDDAMALLYLNACDTLDLLAITTVFGNAHIDRCTVNALILREQFKMRTPVFVGAAGPLNGEKREEFPDFVHGINGLGDIDLPQPTGTPESVSAADAIVELIRRHPGEVTIIAVGHLTNIATAITGAADIAPLIKSIVFMGGACECEGNISPFAEANIGGDPEAAETVFRSGIPLTMVGLDVTLKIRMSISFLEDLISDFPGTGQPLIAMNRYYADFYQQRHGWNDFPVHDSSAVACAAAPGLFETTYGQLSCVLEGEARGQTLFQPETSGHHQVCFGVNSEALLQDYADKITTRYRT